MESFFSTESFMPHGHCLRWDPALVVAMVAGNAMIVLAYLTIPVALLRLLKERGEMVLNRIFLMFAAFIFACGTTHLIKIITIWEPLYWLEAIADTTTGVISLMTAILLIRLIPRIAKLPSAMLRYS